MQVQYVPTEYIHQTWPLVEGYMASALEYSHGEYTPDQAKVYLSNGQWTLYVAVDDAGSLHGACAVQFNNLPNDRVAFAMAIGGKMFTSKEVWQQFVDLLKARGATRLEGAARESVARLWKAKFGFEEKYRIVGVAL